jgi:hypothetical protein
VSTASVTTITSPSEELPVRHRRLKAILPAAFAVLLASAALAGAEVAQKGKVRVSVSGNLSTQTLPRAGAAPIHVSIGGKIATTDKTPPPKLKTLTIEFNRNGRIDTTGLPVCPRDSIQPASTSRALSACRSSLVGKGSFSAEVSLTGQDPYLATGKLLAFNGIEGGKHVLFGQIYSPSPFATSFVIVFAIKKSARGTYGTALTASLPESLRSWGNLTGIELNLARRYTYRGKSRSYLSAGCPAPKGFPGASFPFARTSFSFYGGPTVSSTLTRNCQVKGR